MTWKAPKIVELALGAEINSYACAEAKGKQSQGRHATLSRGGKLPG